METDRDERIRKLLGTMSFSPARVEWQSEGGVLTAKMTATVEHVVTNVDPSDVDKIDATLSYLGTAADAYHERMLNSYTDILSHIFDQFASLFRKSSSDRTAGGDGN